MNRAVAVLLCTAALSLGAQDASLGVQVHGLMTMGDLKDLTNSQVGLGAGLFVNIPLGGGLVLRPMVGAQYVPKGDTLGLAGTQTSVASVDLLVEGLWFPNQDEETGPYLLGAVGAQQWRIRSSGGTTSSVDHTRLAAQGGLGYQATRRIGFELRGFWSPIEKDITATGLVVQATLRF